MNNEQPRILLAVVLSGLILLAWNYFFEQPRTQQQVAKQRGGEVSPVPIPESGGTSTSPQAVAAMADSGGQRGGKEAPIYELSDGQNFYKVDGNLNLFLAKTEQATADFALVTGSQRPFELELQRGGRYLKPFFQFQRRSGSHLEGRDSELGVSATLSLLESGKLHLRLDSPIPTKFRMIFNSREFDAEREGQEGGGFSIPGTGTYKSVRRFLFLAKELEEVLVGDGDDGDLQAKWVGIDSNYHLFAFVFGDKKSIHYQSSEVGPLVVDLNQEMSSLEGNLVFAKKQYDELKALGENLHLGVDFGIFAVIAVPLFKGLQMIYGVIPNWGFAIILLTILIRILTFPLYYKQMKSMNKMKKIQPKMQKIKEKFKGDPRRQQMETMNLFKQEGVNPMGGCLPLILQMPIFIAFYKVLMVSAELDNESFGGWIPSLTEKDPYYLLPILVTFLMWLNQKVMPQASADPTQQKIMSFMPIIFGLIFLNMPAGLNLYILVSTGFGVAQQLFVNKRMEQSPA